MYKYLPIAENLQEMMVMFKSLPAYTLVFDRKSNLVDMNQSAQQFFRVNNVQEFNDRKCEVFPTQDYIKTIILELKKGKTMRYAKTQLRYTDNNVAVVELCACMINGQRDLFLFQLFEISLSNNSDLSSFTSFMHNSNSRKDATLTNWVTNPKNVIVAHRLNKQDEHLDKWVIDTNSLELGKDKYRNLTKTEIIICNLIALNMSVLQIARTTNKTTIYIRAAMRRITEKHTFNFQKEVRKDLDKNACISKSPEMN